MGQKEQEELVKKYKLSTIEHDKIYYIIRDMLFNAVTPVNNPIAIIVGAQPGSGKGSVIGYSKRMFKDNNVVIITTDDYKPFHPKASEIAKNFPTQYLSIVEADSAKWTSEIMKYAIENKYNFIFECTLKNERILDRMKELKENGFDVIVRGIAISYLESLLCVYERYEKQVEARNWGRFFNVSNYNETYANIPNIVEIIEKSSYCDALEIYKRGVDLKEPQIIYGTYKKVFKDKYLNSDFIKQCEFPFKNAKEAIIKGREESELDIANIRKRVEDLERAFNRRKTTEEEREELKKLKAIIS